MRFLLLGLGFFSLTATFAQTQFSLLSPDQTHISFNNTLRETEKINVLVYQYLYNGGGVGVADINNDQLPDIYFSGNQVPDKLYLNNGDMQFTDISAAAGIDSYSGWHTGVSMADVNGDGYIDLYVCRSGPFNAADRKNLLFINNGNNTFAERAAEYGIDDSSFTTMAAFFDYDRDGDLDLFLLNHAVQQYKGFILSDMRKTRDPFAGNKLLRNDNGHFTDVSEAAGINGSPLTFGLGIGIADIDDDMWPDIFVSNDYQERDFLYHNNGDGTFTEIGTEVFGHMSNFTMGCDFADINNDGYMDLFAADMLPEDNHRQKMLKGPAKYNAYQLAVQYGYYHQNMHNVLQLNTVKGYFSDIAFSAGVAMTDWSWSPLFADFDNDGLQDLYVTNGYRRDFTDMDFLHYTYSDAQQKANDAGEKLNTYQMVQEMPSVKTSNYMFRNVSGLAFEQVQNNWGLNIPSFSNGAAYADLDLDGDLDIIVNNINDTAFIFQNNCSSRYRNKWITVKLKGEEKNTYGIGAKVIVRAGDKIYTRFVMPVHGFQSTSDATLTIGVGNADSLQLDVYFPSGRYIHYPLIHSCTYIIVPEKAAEKNEPKQDEKAPFFTDITDKTIQYKSTEETYEDFTREPLLPYKLSSVGPCADMADVNGDGRKDIFIGGAANKKGILFLQDETGFFIPQKGGPWDADAGCADSDVLFFDADNDGDPDLFVTSGGNTYPDGSTQYSNRLYINDGKGNFSAYTLLLEQFLEPATSVSAADYDRDGDIDLAIGLGYTPGKFPLGNGVRILRNGGEEGFYDVTNTIHASFNSAGMISKVQWADMNGDGREELITLGEWNSIHIYEMRKGMLMDRTAQYGLDHTAGLWNTCTLSDIDGDGDMDIIAGNFGTNTQWQASAEQPLTVYSGDLDNNGSIDPIISYYYTDGVSHPLPSRDDIIDAVPDFKKKFIYYADYADISTSDLIADTSELLKANTLRSAVFMNNGDEPWEMMPLPEQAQWYPVYAICASDLNGDGNIDILLAGNNYTVRPELGRQDAGTGTLLLGDGKGNFTCIPADTGSPFIQGEVRDIFFLDSEIICILRKNDAVNVLQLNK